VPDYSVIVGSAVDHGAIARGLTDSARDIGGHG
jgi:hypothetical protein